MIIHLVTLWTDEETSSNTAQKRKGKTEKIE